MYKKVEKRMRKSAKIQWKYVYRYGCALLLTLMATGMFLIAWYDFVQENNQTGHLLGLGNLSMSVLIYCGLFMVIGKWLHAFQIGVERKASIMASQMLTLLVVDFIEVFLSLAITGQFRFFNEFFRIYVVMFPIQTIVLCLAVIPMINFYRRTFPPLQILELHGSYPNDLCDKIGSVPYKYHVLMQMSSAEDEPVIRSAIEKCDAVLLNDLPAEEKNHLLKLCFEMNKRVYFVPKLSDVIVKGAEQLNLFDTPLFLSRNNGMKALERVIKRGFDIILSLAALLLLSPVFLIVAIAIKIEDGGGSFLSAGEMHHSWKEVLDSEIPIHDRKCGAGWKAPSGG